jgi:hypothetical protein
MRVWNEIFQMLEEVRVRIRQKVEGLVEEIDGKYGGELARIAREEGVALFLTVEEGNNNPALIVPTLYVLGGESKAERVRKALGEWVGDYRLTVEAIKFKPTSWKHKYEETFEGKE